MIVKICGITNLEDALIAVEAGADALGFNFYRQSVRYIEPLAARGIVEELPSDVLSVGVFVDEETPESVKRIAEASGVGVVQLHGEESLEYCRALKGRVLIKAVRVSEGFVPESVLEFGDVVDAILLDAFAGAERGGTGRVFDWTLARRVADLMPKVFLAGGLSPENISEAINVVKPYAVDACSRLESTPGRKDAERVRAFVKLAQGSLEAERHH
jgi:phosphoribosylanthranilate isomerase